MYQNLDEDEKKNRVVIEQFKKRLSILKKGHEFSGRGETLKAVEHFKTYISIICNYHEISEEELAPKYFPGDAGVTEIFLISQILWELAKVYDRNPKTRGKVPFYLKLYARFSMGHKFQKLNAEHLRKHIRSKKIHDPAPFKKAYEQMKVKTKACYVASYCYGEDHNVTNELRRFKLTILNFKIGRLFVDYYYHLSPRLIQYLEKHRIRSKVFMLITKPILKTVAIIHKVK